MAKSKAAAAAAKATPKAVKTKIAPAAEPVAAEIISLPEYAELPIGSVSPSPLNPRRAMEEGPLDELVESIAVHGVLQPILVRPASRGRHEIICGARRHRACELAVARGRLPAEYAIPARVMAHCTDARLVEMAATENLSREDMHPLDEAEIFRALRKYVTPAEGEKIEAAIGKKLGVSERTVFRRLSLLRLAPEMQTALRVKEISLQQAAAFTIGHHNDQRAYWKQAKASRWEGDRLPDAIRRGMIKERIEVGDAVFDLALYTGEIVEDPETGERYLGDGKLFRKLQDAAIASRLAELKAKWPWAEFTTDGEWRYEKTTKDDADAGAILFIEDIEDGKRLKVKAPVLRPEVTSARQRQADRGRSTGTRGAAGTGEPRRALTEAQCIALHQAKTRALRVGVDLDIKVALALTVLGLIGAKEVKIRRDNQTPAPDRIEATEAEDELEAKRLAPLFLALAKLGNDDIHLSGDHFTSDDDEQVLLFKALMSFDPTALLELQAWLISRRIGSWNDWHPEPADTPLAVAMAEAVEAPRHLAAIWQPDEAYFRAYSRDRLFELVRANHLIEEFTRTCNLEWSGLNKAKKGDLVATCLAAKPGFWAPDRFAECRFLAEDEMKAALEGPAPIVAEPPAAQAAE